LTNKIQALKKSVTKGDKKKKKEVDTQIEELEREFEEKCKLELSQLTEALKASNETCHSATVTKAIELNDQSKQGQTECDVAISVQQIEIEKQPHQKMSKAKKRKEKKEKQDEQREKDIALAEIENLKGPAHIELTKIKQKLFEMNLDIKEVISDGNCMYYAVADQLVQHLNLSKTFAELRELTCDYMLRNPNEFQPYLSSEETGEPLTIEEYEDYCLKIKELNAPVWGSMTELKALSDVLAVLIQVIQAEGSEILIGDASRYQTKLIITYHRHMFGSGEHYNSTCSLKQQDD
jgi:OTU domain-containing protein 6